MGRYKAAICCPHCIHSYYSQPHITRIVKLLKRCRILEDDFENPSVNSKVIILKEPTDIILLKSHFIRK